MTETANRTYRSWRSSGADRASRREASRRSRRSTHRRRCSRRDGRSAARPASAAGRTDNALEVVAALRPVVRGADGRGHRLGEQHRAVLLAVEVLALNDEIAVARIAVARPLPDEIDDREVAAPREIGDPSGERRGAIARVRGKSRDSRAPGVADADVAAEVHERRRRAAAAAGRSPGGRERSKRGRPRASQQASRSGGGSSREIGGFETREVRPRRRQRLTPDEDEPGLVVLQSVGRGARVARGHAQSAVALMRDGVVLDAVNGERRLGEEDQAEQGQDGRPVPRGARASAARGSWRRFVRRRAVESHPRSGQG